MRNKWLSLCLVVLLLAAFPLTAAAQEFDPNQQGAISVSLVSKTGETPMAGAELSVFHVAAVNHGSDGTLRYTYTEAFANCDIPLDDPELTVKLDEFVGEHSVDCQKIVTDSQGKAACKDLPLGLYLVKQTGEAEGFAPCTPFLVTVPLETEKGFVYHVDASPKTEVARLVDITIRKVWNTGKSIPTADQVTVQLLRNNTVLDTAILNDANNWQVVYTDMPESDAYRIQEVNVPKGFTATYSRNGYTFTVTNTSSLAQTGQLVWPIPVFSMAGIAFLMLGFVILRKPGKENA